MNFRPIILLSALLALPWPAPSQDTGPFPEARYRELRREIRFTPPAEPAPGVADAPADEEWRNRLTLWLLTAVSLGGVAALGYRLYRDTGTAPGPDTEVAATDTVAESYPEETVVNHGAPPEMLSRAEAAGRYDLATRLRFLSLLGELQRAGVLNWRPDLSNQDYQHQLVGHPLSAEFATVIRAYERCWYGGYAVDRLSYRHLRDRMGAMLLHLRPGPGQTSPT